MYLSLGNDIPVGVTVISASFLGCQTTLCIAGDHFGEYLKRLGLKGWRVLVVSAFPTFFAAITM